MRFAVLVLYNLVIVGVAVAGVVIERRRPRLGIGLMAIALLLLITLITGGAILFVPLILALYGAVFGVPALLIWLFVRRYRRRRLGSQPVSVPPPDPLSGP